MKHIHSYYSPNDLYNKIITGLDELGKKATLLYMVDFKNNRRKIFK